jgi:hypothetical protein
MERKSVLPMVAVCSTLWFAGTDPCWGETNQGCADSELAQLYVRLLGTSQ